jgi:inhibitor of cysteine peptidase
MAEILVTQAQNGSNLGISAGDVVVVRLAENPTTGYRWQMDASPGLTLTGDQFSSSSTSAGAGGERIWRFASSASGIFRIEASLRRAWEADVPPQTRFQVTFQVRP